MSGEKAPQPDYEDGVTKEEVRNVALRYLDLLADNTDAKDDPEAEARAAEYARRLAEQRRTRIASADPTDFE